MDNSTGVKSNIISVAFKLFSCKPYSEVTFNEIESQTGLSRGAIQHHFKNKLEIFKAVINESLRKRGSIIEIQITEQKSLYNFIISFIERCSQEKKEMKIAGIPNVNLAHLHIESHSSFYYPEINQSSKMWISTEHKFWVKVINIAKSKREIKEDIDSDKLATLFQNVYLGRSFQGALEEKGCDLQELLHELMYIYDLVKT